MAEKRVSIEVGLHGRSRNRHKLWNHHSHETYTLRLNRGANVNNDAKSSGRFPLRAKAIPLPRDQQELRNIATGLRKMFELRSDSAFEDLLFAIHRAS